MPVLEGQAEIERVQRHDALVNELRELTWKSHGDYHIGRLDDVVAKLHELIQNDKDQVAKDFEDFYLELDDALRTVVRVWLKHK